MLHPNVIVPPSICPSANFRSPPIELMMEILQESLNVQLEEVKTPTSAYFIRGTQLFVALINKAPSYLTLVDHLRRKSFVQVCLFSEILPGFVYLPVVQF